MVFVVVLQPCYLWKRTFLKVCRDCVLGRGDPSTVGWSTKQPVAHKSNPTRDLLNIASRSQWIKVSGALTNRHNIFHRHLLPSSFFSFSPLPSSPSPLFLLLLLPSSFFSFSFSYFSSFSSFSFSSCCCLLQEPIHANVHKSCLHLLKVEDVVVRCAVLID